MTDKVTHVIDLHVWIESVNNTMKKTQKQIRIKWANEIGRTIISLIAEVEALNYRTKISMPVAYTTTLQAGIYSMNIVIAEEVMRCFFSKQNASDHAIFDLLVQELYHISESKTDYELCLPDNDSIQFNCCTIAGRNDLLICTDYSSVVAKTITSLVYGSVFCVLLVFSAFPEAFIKRTNNEYYRISSSPMSLSSVLLSAVFDKQGPVFSAGRKLLFTTFLVSTTFPKSDTHSPWMYFFLFILWMSFQFTNVIYFKKSRHGKHKFGASIIEIITYPLNLMLFWGIFKCLCGKLKIELQSQDNDDEEEEEDNDDNEEKRPFFAPLKFPFVFLIFLVLYIITIPLLYLVSIFKLVEKNLLVVRLLDFHRMCCKEALTYPMIIILSFFLVGLFLFIVFLAQSIFFLAFYFTIGLFLNGENYSPYILPVCTIIFYSWTNWRSSVETKYLVLLTNIYKVSKESSAESGKGSTNVAMNSNTASNTSDSKTLKIRYHPEDGEPMIEKELYNLVREKLLPYDKILFYYFQRVFFILIFAHFLYIMISLAQTSRVPGFIQVISSIAATSLPFIFDFVWKKNSDEKKEADSIALQSKLKHILRVVSSDIKGDIYVEISGVKQNISQTEEKLKRFCQSCRFYLTRLNCFNIQARLHRKLTRTENII